MNYKFRNLPVGCMFQHNGETYEKRSTRTGLNHQSYEGAKYFKQDAECSAVEEHIEYVKSFLVNNPAT